MIDFNALLDTRPRDAVRLYLAERDIEPGGAARTPSPAGKLAAKPQEGGLFRRLRCWAHNTPMDWPLDRRAPVSYRFRVWLSNVFLDYAAWRSRDARYCWAGAAMWAMGFDHDLLESTTPDCGWCGKCQRKARR